MKLVLIKREVDWCSYCIYCFRYKPDTLHRIDMLFSNGRRNHPRNVYLCCHEVYEKNPRFITFTSVDEKLDKLITIPEWCPLYDTKSCSNEGCYGDFVRLFKKDEDE